MDLLKKMTKGQSLPLNTIVIAILVIIVLLIIVVFFTSNIGESGEELDRLKSCNLENAVISGLGYTYVTEEYPDKENPVCSGDRQRIDSVGVKDQIENGEPTGNVVICCGSKN